MKTTNVTSYIDIFEQLYYIFTTYIIHIVHSKYSFCLQLISPYIFYLDENNYPFFPPQPVPEGNEKIVFRFIHIQQQYNKHCLVNTNHEPAPKPFQN